MQEWGQGKRAQDERKARDERKRRVLTHRLYVLGLLHQTYMARKGFWYEKFTQETDKKVCMEMSGLRRELRELQEAKAQA